MTKTLRTYLLVAFGWTWLVGLAFRLLHLRFDSPVGLAVIALLYMPAPLVAAVTAERGVKRDRFRIPWGYSRAAAVFVLAPTLAIVAFVMAYLAAIFIGGNMLHLAAFGDLATTRADLARGATQLLGPVAVAKAGPPPPPAIMLLAGLWGAIVAGWTINGLFALGEEYGWRGLMWDELKKRGYVKANLVIGLVWGLWHAPLILQGYNYPHHPVLGAIMMIVFTTSMSFLLTALREATGSVLSAAAAHGMFNALATFMLILASGGSALLTGPLGILGSLVLGILGMSLWAKIPRNAEAAPSSSYRPNYHNT